MKVKILIKLALVILESLANHTNTQLDDLAIKKLKQIINSKTEKKETK
jgi:flagellar biosynthesis/type III secretory pathway protein FliH